MRRLLTGSAELLAGVAATGLFTVAVVARYSELTARCVRSCTAGQMPMGAAQPGVPVELYAAVLVALEAAFALLHVLVALVIVWRRTSNPVVSFIAFMLVLWGTTFPPTVSALAASDAAWFWPVAAVRFLGAAAVTLFFFVFPDGRFRPPWGAGLAALWIAAQIPMYFAPESPLNPGTWPPLAFAVVSAGFLGVMVTLQVYRYRHVSGPTQRRQTKWVVLGIAFALAGYAAVLVLLAVAPNLARPGTLASIGVVVVEEVSVGLLPVSIAVAILRDRLYDIDVLINKTLVYGTLSVTLAVVYACGVIVLQQVVGVVSGQPERQQPLVIVISTLAIAALFQPLRVRIQRGIDRRFFRRRYDAAKTLAAFTATLRNEVDLDQVTRQLVQVAERTMEPSSIWLWLTPYRVSLAKGGAAAPDDQRVMAHKHTRIH